MLVTVFRLSVIKVARCFIEVGIVTGMEATLEANPMDVIQLTLQDASRGGAACRQRVGHSDGLRSRMCRVRR